MDKSKIVPEIHRYMVCDLQAPMMLSGQKFTKNAKNSPFWQVFEKLKLVVKQCYQKVIFNRTKLVENAKIEKLK